MALSAWEFGPPRPPVDRWLKVDSFTVRPLDRGAAPPAIRVSKALPHPAALGIAPSAGAEGVDSAFDRSTSRRRRRSRCVETGLAAGRGLLSGQPEDHLLISARVGSSTWFHPPPLAGRSRHEGGVLLGAVGFHSDADFLLGHVLQAACEDSGHVAGRGAAEQAWRAGGRRGHLDVLGDRRRDDGRPRISLRAPHQGADAAAGLATRASLGRLPRRRRRT